MWYYIIGGYMRNIGIICEYNPFHNGHLYHINKVKELFPKSNIILVLSGNVTERGDLSILDKWEKAEIALHFGVDLVVELPFVQSSQAADIFCYGSVKLLSLLKVDAIVFGSESNDVEQLKKFAHIQLYDKSYNEQVSLLLDKGINYPTALSSALREITGVNINSPNDLLGLGYVKEIIKNGYNIEPVTIKRTNDYHASIITGEISSATSIRLALKNNDNIDKTVPQFVFPYLNKKIYLLEDYFTLLKYKILSEPDLTIYQTVDKDIVARIKKGIVDSYTLDEFIKTIKTKYYTHNRLIRMCSHILFALTKEEALKKQEISYIRLLGFSSKGKKHLNSIKKELEVPLITSYSNDKDNHLDIEMRVTKILGILKGQAFIEAEYKNKPIYKEKM